MSNPIVMILGWRSGTSSLTKTLYEEGFPVTPPLDMRPMEGHQPEGHYENPQVYKINEALLKHFQRRFFSRVCCPSSKPMWWKNGWPTIPNP